jgi:hypothetical protein
MKLIGAGPAAARGKTVKEKALLEATGLDDNALGLAKLTIKHSSDGRFDLKVRRLDPKATYEVLVDGVRVGAITTTGGGSGSIRFRSRPRSSRDEFLGFDPRGAAIVIEHADGSEVLRVTLDDTPADASAIVCCVPDDDGTECEDRTEAECAAEGGTVSAAASCLPNPCGGVPAGEEPEVICCVPDDAGPECEDRGTAECALAGGITVEATSCASNPCAPTTPPADPDVQCCLPDNGVFACEDRTPAQCAAEGGTDMGVGTCTPDPCAGLTPIGGDDNGVDGQRHA